MCAACCVQSVSVFCLYFCQIKNPTIHLYVVVKGMSSKMLALLRRGYSDKTLILNENNKTNAFMSSVQLLLSCNSSASSAGVSPSSRNDSRFSFSNTFWILLNPHSRCHDCPWEIDNHCYKWVQLQYTSCQMCHISVSAIIFIYLISLHIKCYL